MTDDLFPRVFGGINFYKDESGAVIAESMISHKRFLAALDTNNAPFCHSGSFLHSYILMCFRNEIILYNLFSSVLPLPPIIDTSSWNLILYSISLSWIAIFLNNPIQGFSFGLCSLPIFQFSFFPIFFVLSFFCFSFFFSLVLCLFMRHLFSVLCSCTSVFFYFAIFPFCKMNWN